MRAKKYVDIKDNIAMITLHNVKRTYRSVMEMKRELQKNERDKTKQYWNMVSLLSTVLDHNNLSEAENQDNIIFFTKQMYLQLQKNYPEYGITDEEVEAVSHLAPIHDIGKIRVPVEILNKNGRLTEEEMETVRQHPLVGAEMTKKFPKGLTIDKLNALSYEICRHHHERYDGAGYPDGLHGEEIPLCAQVVGLADAYDALISPRPYKSKLTHGEALQMILNGECGSFSQPLLHCFMEAAMQKEWIKKADS
jgi:putative two-component system response regulator